MPTPHIRSFLLLTLALLAFSGQLVDATTGQPMPAVGVTASGPAHATAKTDSHGRFTLKGLKAGSYTLRTESRDVPPQTFQVTVRPGSTAATTIKVCSMTLDYHCGQPDGGGGGMLL